MRADRRARRCGGQELRHRGRRRAAEARRSAGSQQPGDLRADEDRASARGRRDPRARQRAVASASRPPPTVRSRSRSPRPTAMPSGREAKAMRNATGSMPRRSARITDFFAFYRSMQAYEEGLKSNDTRLVISPNSEFFQYFNNPSGVASARPAAEGTGRRSLADVVASRAMSDLLVGFGLGLCDRGPAMGPRSKARFQASGTGRIDELSSNCAPEAPWPLPPGFS